MRSLVLSVAFAALAACSRPGPPKAVPPLEVRDAWARSADSGTVTVVYFTFVNHEAAPVTLTSASSPLAYSVSLHETMEMSGMVHMMPIDTVRVAPADSLVLAEGGKHLMVNHLWKKLAGGDSLPVTLNFAGGRSLNLKAAVRAP